MTTTSMAWCTARKSGQRNPHGSVHRLCRCARGGMDAMCVHRFIAIETRTSARTQTSPQSHRSVESSPPKHLSSMKCEHNNVRRHFIWACASTWITWIEITTQKKKIVSRFRSHTLNLEFKICSSMNYGTFGPRSVVSRYARKPHTLRYPCLRRTEIRATGTRNALDTKVK